MASGPSTASGIASETVQFISDQTPIRAFLARPSSAAEPLPTLIILHEWWGLNDYTKELARRFAQVGYVVLAPDLYSRQDHKVTTSPQEAADLMNNLSSQHVLRDLNRGIAYLKTQPCVDPQRIGMIGLSMGAVLAMTQASHSSELRAVVAFYGKVPPIESSNYFTCPVMFHHAGKDTWVTGQEVERLTQGLERFGKSGVVHIYPEADHAFFNDSRSEAYRADDARLAWERTLQFLVEHLRYGVAG